MFAVTTAPASAVIAFDQTDHILSHTGFEPRNIELFDLDADGDLDALTSGSAGSAELALLRAQPAGSLSPVSMPGPAGVGLAHPADVTGDGRLDVVHMRDGNPGAFPPITGVVVRPGLAGGGLGPPVITAVSFGADVATGDFDGDARADVVVVGNGGGPAGIRVLHGQADGTFTAGQSIDLPAGVNAWEVEVGDIDGQGQDDAVISTSSGYLLGLGGAQPDGTPTGTLTLTAFGAPVLSVGALRISDVNRDGRDDVISANCCEAPLGTSLRLGQADGSLAAPVTVFGNSVFDVATGDIDDDGVTDLVAADCDRGVAIAFGVGDGTFVDPIAVGVRSAVRVFCLEAVASADISGDGVDDILVGDGYSSSVFKVLLLRNAPFLTTSADALDFGEVALGAGATQTLTVGNDGVADLNLGPAQVDGEGFSAADDGCSGQRLVFGATCTLGVHFAPAAGGASEGHLVLASDDVDPLTGLGLFGSAPAPAGPSAVLAPPPVPVVAPARAPTAGAAALAAVRAARAALRRGGVPGLRAGTTRFAFTTPAGGVVVELAPAARRRSPVVLARASAHVGAAGRVTLRLRITARGRQRLRRGAPVAVTLRASVTPDAGRVASRVLRFTLRPTR